MSEALVLCVKSKEDKTLKKRYEKPVMIIEYFDTEEIDCSDYDSDFYRSYCQKTKKKSKTQLCEPMCGRMGCIHIL